MRDLIDWMKTFAELVPCDLSDGMVWRTKARGDYVTHEGMEEGQRALRDMGITDHIGSIWEAGKPIGIGFNPAEQKWYGWSHRAIFGFGVGSECKKGACHYRPVDKDDFLDDCLRFWGDTEDWHEDARAEHVVRNGEAGVLVEWQYPETVPNESLRGTTGSTFCHYPDEYGRGEWKAETLADARQMAIDFAEGVS